MSKFVKIATEFRDLALLKETLGDLNVSYAEDERYNHLFSDFNEVVPLVITLARQTQFGLRVAEDGAYELIGDDMQLKPIRKVLDEIQQRYAYRKVLKETALAGFELVEEKTGNDDVIRLTVRRWQ